MSKWTKNLISVLLCTVLILPLAATSYAGNTKAPSPAYFDLPVKLQKVKVGISFEETSVRSAYFQNVVGNGFSFGYFDYSRCFHEFAGLDEVEICLRPDTGYTYSDEDAGEEKSVGAWHVLLNGEYEDFSTTLKKSAGYIDGAPAYLDGKFRIVCGSFDTEENALSAVSERALNAEAYSGGEAVLICTVPDSDELMFMTDRSLALRPVCDEKAETYYGGNVYYGDFELKATDAGLTVINYVGIEDYVKGVLPYEMIASWPPEALKAQGICARTYLTHYVNVYGELGFDLRNDVFSQVYKGKTGTVTESNEAAEATSGQYLRYRGAPCKVYYMSSDGGATDSSANVFSQRRAYLSGRIDTNEDELDFYNKTWTAVLMEETVVRRLNSYGCELDSVKSIEASESDYGIVKQLDITDRNGKTITLLGEDCFLALGLYSSNYKVESLDEDLWSFDGRGWGHNCGMSQWGAYSMAKYGESKCDDILEYYFSGAYIR